MENDWIDYAMVFHWISEIDYVVECLVGISANKLSLITKNKVKKIYTISKDTL